MGFIWDGYGVGMFTSDSVGVTAGFSGGVGANITITNADKMEDTGGAGIFVGFNGPFRVGSGDVVMGLDSSAKPKVSNVGLSAGVGFGLGGDVHIQGSTTKVGRIIYQDPDGAKKHKPSGRDPVPAPVPVKTPPNPNATPVPRKP